mmetsp:Transcript_378/g.419  ORF Transcript_378/g.419 Transcript_378/m.419 type:complete len:224 (+) Transcript_378:83-754(+)
MMIINPFLLTISFTLSRLIAIGSIFCTEALSLTIFVPVISTGKLPCTSLRMSINENIPITPTRRHAFKKMGSLLLLSTAASTVNPSVAQAKKSKEPMTPEKVTAAFAAVREQLESPEGGIQELKSLIDKEDFDGIREFTQMYDLEFRKAKMVKARRLITGKDELKRGLYLSNSVTFDLIGINRFSREGKEDISEVKKYWEELKTDVINFLELEKGIDFSFYES